MTMPHLNDTLPSRAVRRRPVLQSCFALLLALLVLCCVLPGITYLIVAPGSVDLVILGLDSRAGEGFATRTDSFMLVNITPRNNDITLLSIPRDVFIEVPNYGQQRINTINVLGAQDASTTGPELVKASINESFGIAVEHYVRIDFSAFVDLIDAVGGIEINVPKTIIDYAYPTADGGTMTIQFNPGAQHMNGTQALQYARTRHQDDDFQRAARQQQVIDAFLGKVRSPGQLVNWPELWRIFRSKVDTDLSWWDAVRLAPAVMVGWSGHTQRVLNRDDLVAMQAGYWIPRYDDLAPWIAQHFD